jgi:peptidoglycan/LPS O-acetylase OafA/YrhL
MKRLDQLTFTRFLMIMVVLFFHGLGGVYFSVLEKIPFSELLRTVSVAVGYLYVLSGFVMALVYFRPEEKFNITGYWRARFTRIYPLYIIAFLLTCYYYLDSILRIKPQKILANIFVVQSWIPAYSQSFNYVAWSMTVEFFFYAVFPFFTLWAYHRSTKYLIRFSLIFWAMSQLIYHILWIAYFPERKDFIAYFPAFHLNSFILGAVGGIWYLREGKAQAIKPKTIYILLIISMTFIAGYSIISSNYVLSLPHGLQPTAGLLAPFMIIFIVALSIDKSRLSNFLNHPYLVALGEASYGMYILHIPLAWLLDRYLTTSSLIKNPIQIYDIAILPLVIAISLLAHFYIDLPIRAWLKKTLHHINIPLLLLDLVIVTASIYFSFRLRFDHPREYASYSEIGRLIFYSAFFIRPALSIIFNTFNPEMFALPVVKLIRPLLISTTIGSAIIAIIAYIGYAAGLSVNFPRSIFLIDWLIVFLLSLLVRLAFRSYWLNKSTSSVSAEQGITHVG